MKKTGRSRSADIVMLGTFGVWTRGTLQSRALPFATELKRSRDLEVSIVTTPWDDPGSAGSRSEHDGVRIFNTRHVRPASAPLAVAEQLRITRALNPSVVHLMKPRGFGGLAAAARKFLPPDCILIVDCDDWEGDGGWNDSGQYGLLSRRLFAHQEASLIRSADGVTAASTLLDERARRLRGRGGGDDVAYLPNGLDSRWRRQLGESAPRQMGGPPVVLLYSRFAEFSMGWLREFIVGLDGGGSALRFELVGEIKPDSLATLPLTTVELFFHGYVNRERIPGLLSRADIAVFPYQDTLINRAKQSVKLLELMAAGRPIVACDIGDIARIAGDAAEICPTSDPGTFARRVLNLLATEDRRQTLAARARERSAQFTIDRLAPRLVTAYERAGFTA